MPYFEFSAPTSVTFGANSISMLSKIVHKYGGRVALIYDNHFEENSSILYDIIRQLEKENLNVIKFETIDEEYGGKEAEEIGHQMRMNEVQVIVSCGTSIAHDIAKASSVLSTTGGYFLDLADGIDTSQKFTPVITVPSSFGSLSALTSGMKLKDNYNGNYKSIMASSIYAKECIIDSDVFTYDRENAHFNCFSLLAYSFDALISRYTNAISMAFALRAMEIVAQNIRKISRGSGDSHLNMCMAEMLTPIAINSGGAGLIYAFSLALYGVCNIPPAEGAALLMPYIMEYNLTMAAGKFVQVAKVFGEDTKDMSAIEAAITSIEHLRRLLGDLSFKKTLSDYGVSEENFRRIARAVLSFDELEFIPRPAGYDDIISLLEQAL